MVKNYKIIKNIGSGVNATTFKVKKNKKTYAMRREKILNIDAIEYKKKFKNKLINENTDKLLYRQIYFNEFINTINKNHFLIIYEYKISKCKFKQKLNNYIKDNPIKLKKYNEISNSNYSIDIITDLKDGTVKDILHNLTNQQIYSLIIQIVYALNIMHTNNYFHRDLHSGNICYKKTSLKTIKIFNLDIPTFGYLFSIIDYGTVISDKFKLNNKELLNLTFRNLKYEDMVRFLISTIFYNKNDTIDNFNTTFVKKLYKLLNNKKFINNSDIEIFNNKKLNYKNTKYYCIHINKPKKIIKYFYKLIMKN
jgi:serine/threonine protein kinase